MVKETKQENKEQVIPAIEVSIPSRGSGKGDQQPVTEATGIFQFQSPLGEVVKETQS